MIGLSLVPGMGEPQAFLATWYLRAFGLLKVPMILFVGPRVVALDRKRVIVRIPLRVRTRNHLGSMYFGALCVGADCAGGLLAMQFIRERKRDISLVFKDFKADFLKRPEAEVDFTCEQGEEIEKLVAAAIDTRERVSMPVSVVATVPSLGGEVVAKFELTLSLKAK